MQTNTVKAALKQGRTVIGTMMVGTKSPDVVHVLRSAGFDFLFVDTEHSPYNPETVATIIREARAAGIVPLIRVPNAEYHLMSKPLDAGAMGLMIPRVETTEQVRCIVQSTKYPPWGIRGCAVRGPMTDYERIAVEDYIQHANQDILIITQIESKKAIDHIDDLLSIQGVDVALIGPNDLSLSLGVPGELDHPLMVDYIEQLIAACRRHGVAPGIHLGNMDLLLKWTRKGMRMITYSTNVGLLGQGAAQGVKMLKEAL